MIMTQPQAGHPAKEEAPNVGRCTVVRRGAVGGKVGPLPSDRIALTRVDLGEQRRDEAVFGAARLH